MTTYLKDGQQENHPQRNMKKATSNKVWEALKDSWVNRRGWEVRPQIWLWQFGATSLLAPALEGNRRDAVDDDERKIQANPLRFQRHQETHLNTPVCLDAVVHDNVPVLPSQYLNGRQGLRWVEDNPGRQCRSRTALTRPQSSIFNSTLCSLERFGWNFWCETCFKLSKKSDAQYICSFHKITTLRHAWRVISSRF